MERNSEKIKEMQLSTSDTNNVLAEGTIVKRNSDGVRGTIERFGNRFGTGAIAYNAYYVRWADGKLGYPNEKDFETIDKTDNCTRTHGLNDKT